MKKNDIFAYPHKVPFKGMPGSVAPKPDPDYEEGMTLRDYFAGQALMGAISIAKIGTVLRVTETAEACYKLADAMLEARSKE